MKSGVVYLPATALVAAATRRDIALVERNVEILLAEHDHAEVMHALADIAAAYVLAAARIGNVDVSDMLDALATQSLDLADRYPNQESR